MAVLPALAIGGAALGTTTSVIGAAQQNKALKRAGQSQNESARVQAGQVASQGLAERSQNRRTADMIAARARVLSIAAGGTGGDTAADLDRTILFDSARNSEISRRNEAARIAAIRSGNSASIAQIRSQTRSMILDSIVGGLQGLSTGLGLGQGLKDTGLIE